MSQPSKDPIIDQIFEDKVLACLLRLNEFAAVAAQHLKPSYFSTSMAHNIAKAAIDFHNKYGAIISAKALVDELTQVVQKTELQTYGNEVIRLQKVDISDHKWVLEKLIVFIRSRATRKMIEEAVSKHLPKNNFDAIERGMAEVAAITTNIDAEPYAHFEEKNIDARQDKREKDANAIAAGQRVGISTGIPEMDRTLPGGGWMPKEEYIILAPPKTGKTMAMLWFANIAAWQGFNVPFFSFETGIQVLANRVDSMNAVIETKALMAPGNNHIRKILKARRPKGQVYFFEYPTKTCTVAEVERQLRKLQIKGVELGGPCICDYGDIMKPARIYRDNPLAEQAGIFEDLRAVAGKFNIPMITPSQINRTGTGKAVNSGTDVSGTYEKIMVADNVIALSGTRDELKEGKLRINFSESRNNERRTFLIKTNYATGTFYKDFISEEQ